MLFDGWGIAGFVILLADLYAIIRTAQSGVTPLHKAVWIAIILILPVLGFVAWLLVGPRVRH